jgi:hypothetical protein
MSVAGTPESLHEQHGLEGEHVRSHQPGHHVNDPRAQQVALVDLQLPVRQVHAQEVAAAMSPRTIRKPSWRKRTYSSMLTGLASIVVKLPVTGRHAAA